MRDLDLPLAQHAVHQLDQPVDRHLGRLEVGRVVRRQRQILARAPHEHVAAQVGHGAEHLRGVPVLLVLEQPPHQLLARVADLVIGRVAALRLDPGQQEPALEERPQPVGAGGRARLRHEVGDEAPVARGELSRDNDALSYRGMLGEDGLDLPELDTESADFHLVIEALQKLQAPIPTPTHQVAGAVHSRSRFSVGVGHETLRILRAGSYATPSGRTVDIRSALDRAQTATVAYPPDQNLGMPAARRHETAVEVVKADSGEHRGHQVINLRTYPFAQLIATMVAPTANDIVSVL